jgi:hypothetical protein
MKEEFYVQKGRKDRLYNSLNPQNHQRDSLYIKISYSMQPPSLFLKKMVYQRFITYYLIIIT